MRIERVRIRGYRCLRDLILDIDDYTAFVGPNGSGKSSALYALDWFFNGGTLSQEDFHSTVGAQNPDEEAGTGIDVEVTFSNLTPEDRRVLGQYGRGERATFRRIWARDGKEKMIGNARQGPGFAAIRSSKLIADIRAQYEQARSQCSTLADVTKKEDILAQLKLGRTTPTTPPL